MAEVVLANVSVISPAYDTIFAAEANQPLATALMAPAFLGWLLHATFYGSFLTQLYQYVAYGPYNDDRRASKLLLWSVAILETAAVGVSFGQAITYGSTQKRDAVTLFIGTFPLDAVPAILAASISVLVQSHLARRAAGLFLGRQRLRSAFIVVIGLGMTISWLAAIANAVLFALYASSPDFQTLDIIHYENITVGVWLWIAAAIDWTLTATLWRLLRSHQRGFNHTTDNILRYFTKMTIQTASYTSVFAFMGALLGVVFPPSDAWSVCLLFVFLYPVSALYSISLIINLGSRSTYISKGDSHEHSATGHNTTRRKSHYVYSGKDQIISRGVTSMGSAPGPHYVDVTRSTLVKAGEMDQMRSIVSQIDVSIETETA